MGALALFEYNMVLVTPPEHELLEARLIQLQDIAQWPLILFGPESSTRLIVEQALKVVALLLLQDKGKRSRRGERVR